MKKTATLVKKWLTTKTLMGRAFPRRRGNPPPSGSRRRACRAHARNFDEDVKTLVSCGFLRVAKILSRAASAFRSPGAQPSRTRLAPPHAHVDKRKFFLHRSCAERRRSAPLALTRANRLSAIRRAWLSAAVASARACTVFAQ